MFFLNVFLLVKLPGFQLFDFKDYSDLFTDLSLLALSRLGRPALVPEEPHSAVASELRGAAPNDAGGGQTAQGAQGSGGWWKSRVLAKEWKKWVGNS